MKTIFTFVLGLAATSAALSAAPDPRWLGHDSQRPLPVVVTPGTPGSQEAPGAVPSDATVLFDGKDISPWVAMDGSPTKWVVKDGALECVPGSGYVRSLQSFGRPCRLRKLDGRSRHSARVSGRGARESS